MFDVKLVLEMELQVVEGRTRRLAGRALGLAVDVVVSFLEGFDQPGDHAPVAREHVHLPGEEDQAAQVRQETPGGLLVEFLDEGANEIVILGDVESASRKNTTGCSRARRTSPCQSRSLATGTSGTST